MASKIEWTDETWNPIIGCSKASPGCWNCYAERTAARLESMSVEGYGQVVTEKAATGEKVWTGKTYLVEKALEKPLRWKRPRKIFVCSMGDLFHESVDFEWIDKVFAVMALCPQHTFQILTKRPERMAEYFEQCIRTDLEFAAFDNWGPDAAAKVVHAVSRGKWPLRNVWLGTSVENQAMADKRIPELLKCPDAVRFISVEPMLGAIDLTRIYSETELPGGAFEQSWDCALSGQGRSYDGSPCLTEKLDWVICGGESGPHARPVHPDWVRSLRDQCKAADVPFMFKQWGEWAPEKTWNHEMQRHECSGKMHRFGKKAAGRVLDGKMHLAFPEV